MKLVRTVRRARVVWPILLILYAGAIFILSNLPLTGGEPSLPFSNGGKLLHFLEFSLFFFFLEGDSRAAARALFAAHYGALRRQRRGSPDLRNDAHGEPARLAR